MAARNLTKSVTLRQGEAKARFNEMQLDASRLATKFSNNLLDATKAFKRLVIRLEEVDGAILACPSCIAAAVQCGAVFQRTTDMCGMQLITLIL